MDLLIHIKCLLNAKIDSLIDMSKDIEIQKYEIIVIQSLKEKDIETGLSLYNEILKYKDVVKKDIVTKYFSISTRKEFEYLLMNIEQEIPLGHILTLHLETHGCDEGIGLSSGDLISWRDFFSLIRPINIKTSNLLMIVLSMCNGAAISSLVEPTKRCPYRAFLGFEQEMKAGDLEEAFHAFYEVYDNMLDIDKALEHMNGVLPIENKPWLYTAEQIFNKVLNPDTNPESFSKVINVNYNGYNNLGEPVSKEQFEEDVRQYFIKTANEYRAYYNFKDLKDM